MLYQRRIDRRLAINSFPTAEHLVLMAVCSWSSAVHSLSIWNLHGFLLSFWKWKWKKNECPAAGLWSSHHTGSGRDKIVDYQIIVLQKQPCNTFKHTMEWRYSYSSSDTVSSCFYDLLSGIASSRPKIVVRYRELLRTIPEWQLKTR